MRLAARDCCCRDLLVDQRAEIEAAYAARGVYMTVARERDGWLALEATAMESCEGGLCT